ALGIWCFLFFFQAEDGIRDFHVTGVQTCALPIWLRRGVASAAVRHLGGGSGGLGRAGGASQRLQRGERSGQAGAAPVLPEGAGRSEERRVGKECRSRWWQYS